ncbi:uncharacterized protein LOC119445162 [Dermacentor silvarum]|uniref:uncharacterized protein LOC119445162 n=1 Tax=Dermacentor silvarum TaxID=543639 RepID=UPI002101220B|nr:uncharacterized protein LOC119445162 [Dermacentor silvarum]
MELDEDSEVIPDAETMEFYRIGPPVPSILRKPGERPKRLEVSRRVSFSKDVSEGSSESLHRRLRFNATPPGRTLRKKQSISIIAFCSFAMVTLVGVFWGYIIHGIVHTEGVTPTPPYRNREYLKASPQEEVLRDLDDSDYAVPNLVFLTERSRRRRLRTPVVVLRRHPPPIASPSPSPPTRRWNRTRSYRPRRRSANTTTTTTRRRRTKLTRKPVFQWRSKVLVTPASTTETDRTGPSAIEDEAATSPPPSLEEATSGEGRNGDDNALFPGVDGDVEDELGASGGSQETTSRRRGGLLGTHSALGDAAGNDTSLAGNNTEVADVAGPVEYSTTDNTTTWLNDSAGAGAEVSQDSSLESSAGDYEDDHTGAGGEETISSNALLNDEEEAVAKDVDHLGRNESSYSVLVDEGTSSGALTTDTTTTLSGSVTTQKSDGVVLGGIVNGTDTGDYYD